MTPSFRQFAAKTLFAFIAGAVAIMFLEVAEQNGVISNLTESISRFAVWSVLVALLLVSSRVLSLSARFAFKFCVFCLLLDFALDVIEDIEYLKQLPLIGRDSQWRHTFEKAAVSGWGCGAAYLMYVLMRDLDSSFKKLQKQNDENVKLNEQLQGTIADLQDAQEQIIQQERLAALGQMASGVAHDLNNALTPVLTFSELLNEGPESYEANVEALECIQIGATHAGQVVEQLQHFYRDNSTRQADRKTELVSVIEIVNQAKDLCRFRWLDEANKRGIHFEVELNVEQNVRPILGNRTELIQLISNLLFNAIDAMDKGGVIKVSAAQEDELVELTVSDQGVGMSIEERKRCFEPFFTRKHTGTGLGLSVCYGIVRRHGGTIRCDANSNGGCVFLVLLPSSSDAEVNDLKKEEDSDAIELNILVIDDDDLVLRSLSALLRAFGNRVDTASDALQGIELARNCEYDLVITDLGLPGISGRGVVAQIKELRPTQQIAVASGWSRDAVDQEFQGTRKPDFYISKPINSEKLASMLDGIRGVAATEV